MSLGDENTTDRSADPLYPALEPFAVGQLAVGIPHSIHYEQCGDPRGIPALFLHGGPGSHTRPGHRRFFDPKVYRVILFDQRGCGRSGPLGGTEANTTGLLVDDIEALRRHLGIDRMLLFGGSWGSTLALAYAIAHPQRVAAMVLRGVFLASRAEVDWYLGALHNFVPEAWEALTAGGGATLAGRYHALVNQKDEPDALAAARRWTAYEDAVMNLGEAETGSGSAQDPTTTLARARVQLHYFVHDFFFSPGELVSGLRHLAQVPTLIVQGRLDMVCPPRTAFELARLLPRGELRIVERGGHSAFSPEMAKALRRAVDDLRGLL